MSFKKSELQALRILVTQKIHNLQIEIAITKEMRGVNFKLAEVEEPSTLVYYLNGKQDGNRLLSLQKKLDKYESILYRLKHEIQKPKKSFLERIINFFEN